MKNGKTVIRLLKAKTFSPEGWSKLVGRAGGVYEVRPETAAELIEDELAEIVNDRNAKPENPPMQSGATWTDPKLNAAEKRAEKTRVHEANQEHQKRFEEAAVKVAKADVAEAKIAAAAASPPPSDPPAEKSGGKK